MASVPGPAGSAAPTDPVPPNADASEVAVRSEDASSPGTISIMVSPVWKLHRPSRLPRTRQAMRAMLGLVFASFVAK